MYHMGHVNKFLLIFHNNLRPHKRDIDFKFWEIKLKEL